jgi:membrane protease YdiL (CAAX protease family)
MEMSKRHCMKDLLSQPGGVADRRSRRLLLLSPFAVIAVGQLAARILGPTGGTWAWAYLFLGYWITLAGLILWGGGRETISRWLQPSQGGPFWPVIALAFSFATTLWLITPNWRLLLRPEILFPTIVFVLVNPCLEEGYWRGLIIDAAVRWPIWLAILYSGCLSAINHLFVMAIVAAARNPVVWVYQLILGLLMGVVYIRTKSLRWSIVSHAIVNMLSLTVAMFLNVYVPGPPG